MHYGPLAMAGMAGAAKIAVESFIQTVMDCKAIYTKLPSLKLPMKIPIFPGKYHQNGGFSMAMLVYRRVGSIG